MCLAVPIQSALGANIVICLMPTLVDILNSNISFRLQMHFSEVLVKLLPNRRAEVTLAANEVYWYAMTMCFQSVSFETHFGIRTEIAFVAIESNQARVCFA
jgi:hypothetical protein